MTYPETIDYLFSQLPMYQRQGKSAFKKDLTNIIALCKHNNNPQTKFKSIHIAGTNGKGSVSHILASILQTAGYKTGLYTSPHLKDFRERIRVNGEMISEEDVIQYVDKNKSFFETQKPSFFEMTVAMSFNHFAEQEVDIAIIETGMGGRLDSTNILNPILTAITNISLDHIQFLGNTIEEIAFEKAGIIKEKTPIVIGETNPKSASVFIETAKKKNAPIYFADSDYQINYALLNNDYKQVFNVEKKGIIVYKNFTTDLIGLYQKKNIITSLKILELLGKFFQISTENLYSGILNVQKNTGLAGRWQILGYNPLIVADTGHNIAGIKEVLKQLETTAYKKLHFIFGTVNDKNIDSILKLLPKNAVYYFAQANIPRSLDVNILKENAKNYNLKGNIYLNTTDAFEAAKQNAEESDLILIGGSTFIVAEVI